MNRVKNETIQLPGQDAEMIIVFNSSKSIQLLSLQWSTVKGGNRPGLEEFLICGSTPFSFWGKVLKTQGPCFAPSEYIPTVNMFKYLAASLQIAAFV